MAADKSSRLDRLGDGGLVVIEGLASIGAWGSAGVAVAMGKFLLAGVLTALGLGVFLRLKRLRTNRRTGRG
ncbi:hypothetical protein [Roseateles sp.]|uniref:hypothetical protein n=1 Tax=Roseateles sp. TaxID=1971397 RepID=UPI0039E9D574